jgi:hypothetical protein
VHKNHIVEHAKVFAIAVKYQVDGLRHLAALKFRNEMRRSRAYNHDNFAEAVAIIFRSTPEDVTQLRDVVEELLDTHFEELQHKPDVEVVVTSFPQLSCALLKRSRARAAALQLAVPMHEDDYVARRGLMQ